MERNNEGKKEVEGKCYNTSDGNSPSESSSEEAYVRDLDGTAEKTNKQSR